MNLHRSVLLLPALVLALGCATRASFNDSPTQPAAEGWAKVGVDDNRNSIVTLELRHLAPPRKLTPPRSNYVVWAMNPDGRVVQLGLLRVDDDREARFTGSTPFQRLRLLVTAEDVATPQRPSDPYVLATDFIEPRRGWFR